MKKTLRKLLCAAGVAAVLGTTSLAAPVSDISIKLNGQPLTFTDAVPQIVNDRTYLPFRTVFAALGFEDENITYDGATRTVTAVGDDVTVSMVIGENQVSVTRDGKTEILETDAPAFIDPAVNRTLVPARFISEAAGYDVGWDGETRTVIIDDVDAILAANEETYEILELYLDYGRKFQEKKYQVDGSYTADMILLEDTMKMEGDYSMLMEGGTKFDFDMQTKMSGNIEGEDLAAVIPEGIDLEMRGDMGTGVFYFKSDALMTMMETGVENMWFRLDTAAMLENMSAETGLGFADLYQYTGMMTDMSGREYIDFLVRMMAEADPAASAADHLAVLNAMLGDSAYTKQGGAYVNSFEMDGAKMSMTFHTSGGKVSGYEMLIDALDESSGMALRTQMEMAMLGDEMTAEIVMDMGGTVSMEMTMDGTYTVTNQAPAGAPGEDAAVMDLSEMLGDLPMSGTTEY